MRLLVLQLALQCALAANYEGWEYQLYDYEYGEEYATPTDEFVDFTTFPPTASAHCDVRYS